MHRLLQHTDQRPFPPPSKPWVGFMRWHDLLFGHYSVDPEHVRAAMPASLRAYLDVRDGAAWVGVIPFTMTGIRARWMPPLPGFSRAPELNVRTYVTIGGKPGVYFFSLDLMNRFGVVVGRVGFSLPYYYARVQVTHSGAAPGARIRFKSSRAATRPAEYSAEYAPQNESTFHAQAGSLEYFLTERYCLYTTDARRRILRVNIHHLPWSLQRAEANIFLNTMDSAVGLQLPTTATHLLYAREMEVLAWSPELLTDTPDMATKGQD
jgi:uncharacterized protein